MQVPILYLVAHLDEAAQGQLENHTSLERHEVPHVL